MNAAEVEEGGPLEGKQTHAKGLALALRRDQGLLRRPHTCMLFALASPPLSTCLLTIWHLKGQKSIEEAEAAEKEEEITFQQ